MNKCPSQINKLNLMGFSCIYNFIVAILKWYEMKQRNVEHFVNMN